MKKLPTNVPWLSLKMGYSRKKKKTTGVEDMEFPGVIIKKNMEFPQG